MIKDIDIFSDAKNILKRLIENGYKAYIVGGCVRDSLMEKIPYDWDICTSATPCEIIEVFSDFKVIKTGIKHGTVSVIVNGKPYEVTTFRTDGEYCDNRRPERVLFVKNLRDDLSRRDFTINAIAYNEDEGIIDYFGGIDDLGEKVIRCVGEPDVRFTEDALRILRAIRFSAVLGFRIHEDTKNSILKNALLLKNISKERVFAELKKILVSDGANVLYEYKNVFSSLLENRVLKREISKEFLKLSPKLSLRLCAYIYNLCKEDELIDFSKRILKTLRVDNKTRNAVIKVFENFDTKICDDLILCKKQISRLGKECFCDLVCLKRALFWEDETILKILEKAMENYKYIQENNLCVNVLQMELSGDDLVLNGICSGKAVGETLDKLLELIIEDKIKNKKEDLLKVAIKLNQKG